MAKLDTVSIDIKIEPLSKVVCTEVACRHNLSGDDCCNLKHILIEVGGRCGSRVIKNCGCTSSLEGDSK